MNKLYKLTLFAIFFIPLSTTLQYVIGSDRLLLLGDVWYVNYVAMYMMFGMGSAFVLWKFNKWMSIFLMISLFSAIVGYTGDKFVVSQTPSGMMVYTQLNFALLAIYLISKFSRQQRKRIYIAMLLLLVIQGFWVIAQTFDMDKIFTGFGTYMKEGRLNDTVGLSGSHNQIGVFFATLTPLAILMCPWVLPFIVFGLWCSTTSAAWLSFIFSCIWLTRKTKLIWISVPLIIACTFVFYAKYENMNKTVLNERILLWQNTIRQANDGKVVMKAENITKIQRTHPWLGFRINNFSKLSPYSQKEFLYEKCEFTPNGLRTNADVCEYNKHVYMHAHNDYLEVYFELGKIGFISLLLIILHFFYCYFISKKTKLLRISFYSILAQMICALAVFTIHTAISGMLLILNLGIFFGEWREINE